MQVSQLDIEASDQLVVFPLLLGHLRRKLDRVDVLHLTRDAKVLGHLRTFRVHQVKLSLKLRAKILRTVCVHTGYIFRDHAPETLLNRFPLDIEMASDPIENFLKVSWH